MDSPSMQSSLIDLSHIVNKIPGLVYTYTVNHETGKSDFPFVSDHSNDMFGLPPSEITKDPEIFVNLVHPDDVPVFTEAVLESMNQLTVWDLKFRMKTKSGETIRIHGKSTPSRSKVKSEDGKVTELTVWHGILMDISSESQEEERDWKDVINKTYPENLQPCFGIDKNGIIQYWNDPMTILTGFTASEAVQKTYEYLLPLQRGADTNIWSLNVPNDEPMSADRTYGKHIELRCRNEEEIKYVYATYRQTILPSGEVSGVLCTCQDITAWKMCQKEKEATQELLDAEKNLTEWLSHEIRNPLSIAMEASLALKDTLKQTSHMMDTDDEPQNFGEGTSYVDLISQCIVYVVDLLTNILDLNKCIEGKIVLRPKLCMVKDDVIQPVIQMMSLPHHARSDGKHVVPIQFQGDSDIKIFVDKLRLKQVIMNLLSNALKFTKEGFIRVSMRKIMKNEDMTMSCNEDSLMITVSDSGPGISEDNHHRIFQKWQQFSAMTSGAGIGLCISRLLVNAMGGAINFNKDYHSGIPGKPGAQFVVILPLNQLLAQDYEGNALHNVQAFNALSAAVIASGGGTGNAKDLKEKLGRRRSLKGAKLRVHGKYRLLIVDDDKMNRKIFRKRFSRLFPEAIIDDEDDGSGALETTKTQHYDIICMDQYMDKMNGDEAIRLLRDRGVDSFIVGMSANSKEMLHYSAGAETFFQKPIPKDDVLIEKLFPQLPPPAGWKVLILEDVKLNIHFLKRKLCKVASSHFLSLETAEKHWTFAAKMNSTDAIEAFQTECFDLIILDNYIEGDDKKGIEVAEIARNTSLNPNAIIVLNSGSDSSSRLQMELLKPNPTFDVYWPKPLPTVEQMRTSLTQVLVKTISQ